VPNAPLPWLLAAYLLLSLGTLCVWAFDKRRARGGGRRVRERTLHGLALLGGWPGAWLGRRWLRHKTRKASFRWVLASAAVLHVAAWAWVLTR
jgi:uncharacterized membrane protein YsdA (DUF1294 family)